MPLIQIGLKTRDIPEAGDLHFVKRCIKEAMGLWSQENKITSVRFLLDMELKTELPIDDNDRIELLETIEAVEQKMEDEDADRVP